MIIIYSLKNNIHSNAPIIKMFNLHLFVQFIIISYRILTQKINNLNVNLKIINKVSWILILIFNPNHLLKVLSLAIIFPYYPFILLKIINLKIHQIQPSKKDHISNKTKFHQIP